MAEPHRDASKDSLFDFFDEKEKNEHCKEKTEEGVGVERSISEVVSSFMNSSSQSVRDESNGIEETERKSCKSGGNERESPNMDEKERESPDKDIKDDMYADEEYEQESSDEEENKRESSDDEGNERESSDDERNERESSEDEGHERESKEVEENERGSADQHDEKDEGISFSGSTNEMLIFRPVTDGNDPKVVQTKGDTVPDVNGNEEMQDGDELNNKDVAKSDLRISLEEVEEDQDCDAATISWRTQGSDWDKNLDSDRKVEPTEKENITNRSKAEGSPNSARSVTEKERSSARSMRSEKDGELFPDRSVENGGKSALSQRSKGSLCDQQIPSKRSSNNKEKRELSEGDRNNQRSRISSRSSYSRSISRENSVESKLNSKVFTDEILKKNQNSGDVVKNENKGKNTTTPFLIDTKNAKTSVKSDKAVEKKNARKDAGSKNLSPLMKSGNNRRKNKKENTQKKYKNAQPCNGENNNSKSRFKGENGSDTSVKSGSTGSTLKLPPIHVAPSDHPYTDSSNEELIHVDYLKVHSRPKNFKSENAKNQKRYRERNAKKYGRNESELSRTPHTKNEFPSFTGSVLTDNSRLSLPSINGGQSLTKQKYYRKCDGGSLMRSTSLDSSLMSDSSLYENRVYACVIDGFEQQIMKIKKPRVPVPLKAEAMYRDGQLEVSVTDDQPPTSENVNVKITLVHKYVQTRNRFARANRVYGQKGQKAHHLLSGPADRDIIKHRAMYPPMNTYIDEEASNRHRQFYYGKIEK